MFVGKKSRCEPKIWMFNGIFYPTNYQAFRCSSTYDQYFSTSKFPRKFVAAALNTPEAAPSKVLPNAVSHDFSNLRAHKYRFFHFGLTNLRKFPFYVEKPNE
jgi:hypothetical protein